METKSRFMNKKTAVISILLLIFVVTPLVVLLIDNRQRGSQIIPDKKVVTVSLSDEGFMPQHLKITKGTKVIWINSDNENYKSMQIVANGTQDKMPTDISQKDSVGLNGTYSYTFDKDITLNYRNGNDPKVGGIVEVVDN